MASKVAIATGAGTFDGLAAGPVSGRGVLLLHGFPEDSGQWLRQLPALAAAGFRAVAFDQRGYSSGVRPVEVDAYGPENLIRAIDKLGRPIRQKVSTKVTFLRKGLRLGEPPAHKPRVCIFCASRRKPLATITPMKNAPLDSGRDRKRRHLRPLIDYLID